MFFFVSFLFRFIPKQFDFGVGISVKFSIRYVCWTWMGPTHYIDRCMGDIYRTKSNGIKVCSLFTHHHFHNRVQTCYYNIVIMSGFFFDFRCHFAAWCRCWWGYNFTAIYWIVEGPRLAMLLVNLVFLLNIIRVLILKLRRTNTSDIQQARKAVRAAIFLIPLLGITNILNMTEAPLDRTPFEFALWSYTTHFLTSFQGFFIATLYCFLNNEVNCHWNTLAFSKNLKSSNISCISCAFCTGTNGNSQKLWCLYVTPRKF